MRASHVLLLLVVQAGGGGLHQQLRRSGMAEEGRWAGRHSISPSLEDRNQVTDLGAREPHLVREYVQRGAQTPDNTDDLSAWGIHPVRNSNRIVLPDDLP